MATVARDSAVVVTDQPTDVPAMAPKWSEEALNWSVTMVTRSTGTRDHSGTNNGYFFHFVYYIIACAANNNTASMDHILNGKIP